MQHRSKLLLAALIATTLLSLAVGSASARRISASSSTFRIVWRSFEFIAFSTQIACPVTLEGSFHSRTIAKVSGALIGYIDRAIVGGPCTGSTGGRARALTETLPWHVRFASWTGTLPTITSLHVTLVGLQILYEDAEGVQCQLGVTEAHPIGAIAEGITGNTLRTLRLDEMARIPLGREFVCNLPEEGHLRGQGELTQQGSTTQITLRLVQ